MTSAVARGVFISYSRVNGEVVTIAAKLLRAGGATVFQDVVDIEYGTDWQEALAKAIHKCERVLVFWSLAASTSEWVEREWRMALQAGKRIVPMLLDTTPLPKELSRFNGMPELMQLLMLVKQRSAPADPLGAGGASAQAPPEPPPRPASASTTWSPEPSPPPRRTPMRQRSFLLPAIGVVFGTVFCGVLFYGFWPLGDRSVDVVAVAPAPASAAAPAPAPASVAVAPAASSAVGPSTSPASTASAPSVPPPVDALEMPAVGWSPAIVVGVLVLLGVVLSFLLGRRKNKLKTDADAGRIDEDVDVFSVETPPRQSWEENFSVLDLGWPAAADIQSRLVREIGPLFTRQLFD